MIGLRTLLPYQDRWIADPSGLRVIEKSRRVGISWAQASDAVLHAANGAGDVYYQAYDKDMTRGFIDDCAEWAEHFQKTASAVGETLLEDEVGAIQVFRIGFASGKQIRAMTSSPRGFRGKGRPGDIAIIDEAAFIDDLGAVLKAAMAFRMWGGAVHVISTHNGEASPFAALCRDIRERTQPGSLHTVTLGDALAQGLYRRICRVAGQPWSPGAQDRWETELRAEYGHRAAEELDCVPSSGAGAWLSWEAIGLCRDRLAGIPEHAGTGQTFIGIDVARRRDLWVAAVLERVGDVRWCRDLIVERDIPFSRQRAIVRDLVRRYRPARVAVDQTGMGEAFVEQLRDDHGSLRIEGVLMTAPRPAFDPRRGRAHGGRPADCPVRRHRRPRRPLLGAGSGLRGGRHRRSRIRLHPGRRPLPLRQPRSVGNLRPRRLRHGHLVMAGLVDQYGRPIRPARLKAEIAGPSIVSVRTTTGFHQAIGVTPPQLAAILREAECGDATAWLDLAEDMEERDLHYLAVLGTRRRQVSQLAVTVEPADDSAESQADADLVRAWIGRQEIEDELFDMLDAVAKGFSVMEIIWDVSERQWMPARLEYRLPRWFRFDPVTADSLLLRDAQAPGGWAGLEPGKFVVHRHAAKSGIPVRGGLARVAAWAWMFKSYTLRDWVRFVEAYGQPLRLGTYHGGASREDIDVLRRAVFDIAADAGAVIPEGMDIRFESAGDSGRSGSAFYSDLLAYLDAQVSKAVLGQTLTTDAGDRGSGSYALGRVHDDVRQDIERSDARQLAATLARDIARPIVLPDNGDPGRRGFPRLATGRGKEPDIGVMAGALARRVPTGPDNVSKPEVRSRPGLAEPRDGEDVPGAPDRAGDRDTGTRRTGARAAAARAGPEGDPVDRAVAIAVDGREPLMQPMIEPIPASAEEATGLEDFRARLPEIAGAMDTDALTQALTQALHRRTLTAALSGAAGLTDDDGNDGGGGDGGGSA